MHIRGVCSLSEVHRACWLLWTLGQHMDLAGCRSAFQQSRSSTSLAVKSISHLPGLKQKEFQVFIKSLEPGIMLRSRGLIFTFRRWPERIKMVSLYSKLGKLLLKGGREKGTETFTLFSDGLKMAVRSKCAPKGCRMACAKWAGVLRLLPAGKCRNLANSATRHSEG